MENDRPFKKRENEGREKRRRKEWRELINLFETYSSEYLELAVTERFVIKLVDNDG